MNFFLEDYKERRYLINAIPDTLENEGGLFCMIHKCDKDGAPEEDFSSDFCIHPDECNCGNEEEVEKYVNDLFADNGWVAENVPTSVEDVLNEYHSLDLERMPVADALDKLSVVAEKMAKMLETL